MPCQPRAPPPEGQHPQHKPRTVLGGGTWGPEPGVWGGCLDTAHLDTGLLRRQTSAQQRLNGDPKWGVGVLKTGCRAESPSVKALCGGGASACRPRALADPEPFTGYMHPRDCFPCVPRVTEPLRYLRDCPGVVSGSWARVPPTRG